MKLYMTLSPFISEFQKQGVPDRGLLLEQVQERGFEGLELSEDCGVRLLTFHPGCLGKGTSRREALQQLSGDKGYTVNRFSFLKLSSSENDIAVVIENGSWETFMESRERLAPFFGRS